MRNRLVTTPEYSADVATPAASNFSKLSKIYEASGVRDRMPLAIAILSVAFQSFPEWIKSNMTVSIYGRSGIYLISACLVISAALALSARTARLGVGLFIAIAVVAILPDWTAIANHTYLALWSIPAAILFRESWKSDLYAFYLRMTLGIVMLAAFTQKTLAGTYVDGSFIAYASAHLSPTERMFSFLCDAASSEPCLYYRAISIFILAWQLTVGILLLLGLNSLLFLAIEIGFLLGAGVYADEMNFQILNIALLCIIFRFGMPLWLLLISIVMLVIDLYGIGNLVKIVLDYAA
jgi:hypothetical protein